MGTEGSTSGDLGAGVQRGQPEVTWCIRTIGSTSGDHCAGVQWVHPAVIFGTGMHRGLPVVTCGTGVQTKEVSEKQGFQRGPLKGHPICYEKVVQRSS